MVLIIMIIMLVVIKCYWVRDK